MRSTFGQALLLCALVSGCAIVPRQPTATEPEAECREVFRRVDQAVAEAGVQDGMAARVEGFPYLRVSRFLASYGGDPMGDKQFAEWMNRMAALGRQGHAIEIANLSSERAEALGHALWGIGRRHAWVGPALAECAERLAVGDYADPARRSALRAAARVPDDYATGNRILGLYWLTRVPFASGIREWHREVQDTFAQPLDALPVRGRLLAYAPPSLEQPHVAALLARASSSPLGIPDPHGDDLEALFRAFAPTFLVDTATEADVPGELGWGEDGLPRIVSRRPVVYRRVSHARYEGRALLQLNYWIWFPERPRGAGWDILGGRLDGVLWRVTLGPDGEPVLFDSIHPCGCYHLFFPTERARLKPQPDDLDEAALAPQTLPRLVPRPPVTLRLASGTHYIERVVTGAASGEAVFEYAFAEDDALRSVEFPGGGRRSLFRPDGIVPGSERGERWLFWPMGVLEPGAMRQWGRHPTAFVGRRHFDDPGLLERYFEIKEP